MIMFSTTITFRILENRFRDDIHVDVFAEFLEAIVTQRDNAPGQYNVNNILPCQEQQSVASEVMSGPWWTLRPGASLCTHYIINVGRSLVGLHYFHVTVLHGYHGNLWGYRPFLES